jgi:hypothetical protein
MSRRQFSFPSSDNSAHERALGWKMRIDVATPDEPSGCSNNSSAPIIAPSVAPCHIHCAALPFGASDSYHREIKDRAIACVVGDNSGPARGDVLVNCGLPTQSTNIWNIGSLRPRFGFAVLDTHAGCL